MRWSKDQAAALELNVGRQLDGNAKRIVSKQQDLHLKLRPDDVWLAILTQFTFFVNGNDESLRSIFVSHQGQLKLVFDVSSHTIETIDIGTVAQQLASMVQQKRHDPPTRIHHHHTAQPRHGGYATGPTCSFAWPGSRRPSAATKRQFVAWTARLTKVLEYTVGSFDRPGDADVRHFWASAVHQAGGNSSGGVTTLSGWLTAFR
ncbi:hypothetical protein VTI74DRAFT_6078 [Chaetomium olivicolor]